VIGLIVGFLVAAGLLWFIQELLTSPRRLAMGWRKRNQERGREAISHGLIAIAAGDLRAAERAVQDASRRTPDLPLARLLQAQTAQLKGDRAAARRIFQDMTEDPQTRIAGLRGLYVEAEREGEAEAAYLIAERAREEAPSTPWAARALLRHQISGGNWDGALKTLSGAADGRVLDKRTARRQRAVILAAKALELEDGDPDSARAAALEAHELAPDLVPAAVAAGRLLSRQGDIRRATRVLETTWKAVQHPEIAEAYTQVRAGDSASDRLKRAEALLRMRPHSDEGRLAVARAAIEARDFARAREVLTPVLTSRATQRGLMLMAELEEAETGDRGRAREWIARAVRAPRDPVWTADGIVLQRWAPASPVTGRLDTVEWKVPVAELEGPGLQIDAAELEAPIADLPEPTHEPEPALRDDSEPERTAEGASASPPTGSEMAAGEPEIAAAAMPVSDPAEARPLPSPGRTNGTGGLKDRGGLSATTPVGPIPGDMVIPPAAPAGLEPDPARPDEGSLDRPSEDEGPEPLHPPIPDDPGVTEEERLEKDSRRFKVF
jgi:HemY protein